MKVISREHKSSGVIQTAWFHEFSVCGESGLNGPCAIVENPKTHELVVWALGIEGKSEWSVYAGGDITQPVLTPKEPGAWLH